MYVAPKSPDYALWVHECIVTLHDIRTIHGKWPTNLRYGRVVIFIDEPDYIDQEVYRHAIALANEFNLDIITVGTPRSMNGNMKRSEAVYNIKHWCSLEKAFELAGTEPNFLPNLLFARKCMDEDTYRFEGLAGGAFFYGNKEAFDNDRRA